MTDTLKVIALTSLFLLATSAVCFSIGARVVPEETPIGRQAEIAWSFLAGNGIQPPEFYRLIEEIKLKSRTENLPLLQDVISLGEKGDYLPKHSYLSSILVVPFIYLFGNVGFWIFQFLAGLTLVTSTYLVARQFDKGCSPLLAVVCCLIFTQLVYGMDTYLFSYDLHAAAALMMGLALSSRYPLLAGGVLASLVFFRASNIILLPLCLIAVATNRQKFIRLLFGCSCILVAFLFSNWCLYGGAFILSYYRIPIVTPDGGLVILPHETGFNWATFSSEWASKLFIFPKGWLIANPILFMLPIVFLMIPKLENKKAACLLLSGVLVYSSYIFSYEYWGATYIGNRFLLPATFMAVAVIIPAIRQLVLRFQSSESVKESSKNF